MESTAACRCSCAGLPRHSRTSSGLQELKTPDEKFPRAALEKAGYGAIWHGQKSWNGVAILERGVDRVETRRREAPQGGGGRPRSARLGKGQRSRSGLDRAR